MLDEFLLALGKALYLAAGFEAKCRWVLQIATIARHYESTGDYEAAFDLARKLEARLLGRAIPELAQFPEFDDEAIRTLDRARQARNAIAHTIPSMPPLYAVSVQVLEEQSQRLQAEVEALVAGDNLVSAWCYEIEEKEPAPRHIKDAYPEAIREWLWGDGRITMQ